MLLLVQREEGGESDGLVLGQQAAGELQATADGVQVHPQQQQQDGGSSAAVDGDDRALLWEEALGQHVAGRGERALRDTQRCSRSNQPASLASASLALCNGTDISDIRYQRSNGTLYNGLCNVFGTLIGSLGPDSSDMRLWSLN